MGTGREKHHDSPMAMEMISGALEQFFPRKTMGKPWENHWNMGMSWGLTLLYLVGGLEHFLFSICWECDNPN